MKKRSRKTNRNLPMVLGLIAFALVIRIIYYQQLSSNPFFEYAIVDSDSYDDMAVRIADGRDAYPGLPFFQPPLYPYFLGFLYSLFGRSIPVARFLQMLLGVLNVFLAFTLGRRLFDSRIALGTGLVLSIYGTMIFFEGELLAPVLIIFLNLLLILSLIQFFDKPAPWRAFLSGILLGASSITMAVVLSFLPVILGYGYLSFRKSPKAPPKREISTLGLYCILGVTLVIAPVTIRNTIQGQDTVLISSNAGINFYVGTGESFDKKVGIRPGLEWQALGQEPMRAGHAKPSDQSRYFVNKSLKVILKDPAAYLRTLGSKLLLFSNGNEILRNQGIYPFRAYSPLLAFLVWKNIVAFPYGVLFPLASIGAFSAAKRKKKHIWLLLLFVTTHILTITVFFVCARYRMNVIPFLVLFAVYGATCLYREYRESRWRSAATSTAALGGLLLLSNLNIGDMPDSFNADAYYNLGVKYLDVDRAQAKEMFRKAVELVPEYPEANGNLGIILHQEGDFAEARACFAKVLRQYPDDIETNINMGILLFTEQDVQGAKQLFRRVLLLDPKNEIARSNLEILERKPATPESAPPTPKIAELLGHLMIEPENPALLTNLGAAYLGISDYKNALEPLEKAVALDPSLPQAHNNLGIALINLGNREAAKQEFLKTLELDPTNKSAERNLEHLATQSDP